MNTHLLYETGENLNFNSDYKMEKKKSYFYTRNLSLTGFIDQILYKSKNVLGLGKSIGCTL